MIWILVIAFVVLALLYYSGNQTVTRLAATVNNAVGPLAPASTSYVQATSTAQVAQGLVSQGGAVLASAPVQPGTSIVLIGSSSMNAPQTTGPLFQGQLTYGG